MSGHIRPARTPDVAAIHDLIAAYTEDRRMLAKAMVTLYEDEQDVLEVAEDLLALDDSDFCRKWHRQTYHSGAFGQNGDTTRPTGLSIGPSN